MGGTMFPPFAPLFCGALVHGAMRFYGWSARVASTRRQSRHDDASMHYSEMTRRTSSAPSSLGRRDPSGAIPARS
jgi:hypothetical protein